MSGMTPMTPVTAPNSGAAPMSRSGRRKALDRSLASGIIAVTPTGLALFLLRAVDGSSDHGGEWCFPGGGIEEGETEEAAALREFEEEVGHVLSAEGILKIHQAISEEGVDFTTFEAPIDRPFMVEIDDEHVGFAWCPLDKPPQPLHPGCTKVLEELAKSED